MNGNTQLLIAGWLSLAAAMAHVAIIFVGPSWYRLFGAGERMAQLAEAGSRYPALVTAMVALMLTTWALYAWSGAGVLMRLPLLKLVLVLITATYLVRALAGFMLPWFSSHPFITGNSMTFWLTSSAICLLIGLVHLLGQIKQWPQLGH